MTKRFLINTFGCQMNRLDSELMAGELIRAGYTQVDQVEEADVILFNACSVRQRAEERVYSNLARLKELKSRKPDLIIGLVGCMGEMQKDRAFERIPYLNLVCGPHQHKKLPGFLDDIASGHATVISTNTSGDIDGIIPDNVMVTPSGVPGGGMPPRDGAWHRPAQVLENQASAYVLAMHGCDNYCSYCVVPYLRGRETSRPLNDIVSEVCQLAESGCKEITLLGQNIASYLPRRQAGGKALDEHANLARLLEALNKIDGIQLIRFITSHPAYVTKELFKAIKDLPKVCEYLHMPAQSGSDKMLKAMNRRYTAEDYLARIDEARDIIPSIEFCSDFIVGFPGETEADFQATVDLVRQARFLNSFVFQYSTRPGTKAAQLEDNVPAAVKKERNNLLLSIQSEISRQKNQLLIGKIVEILVEGRSRTNPKRLTGRTRQNHIVHFDSKVVPSRIMLSGVAGCHHGAELSGQLARIKITSATNLSLRGDLYR